MSAVEQEQARQAEHSLALQLRIEDLEDQSRWNNLRLCGLPEATGPEDLRDTVDAIFCWVLDSVPPESLELDLVHRALSPSSTDPNMPCNIICCLHRYTHKEDILRKAWTMETIDFDGATIKILPDLSKATLQRQALV